MSIAERLAITPELRDTDSWPRPSFVDDEKKSVYEARKGAIIDYLDGKSFAQIKKDHKVPKSEVYRVLARCLTVKPDGKIYGFFGAVPGQSVVSYVRRAAIDPTLAKSSRGLAGAFLQLMSENDDLRLYVERKALKNGGNKRPAFIAKTIKQEFLRKCAKVRAEHEYPFCTDDRGGKALVRYIQRIIEENFTPEEIEQSNSKSLDEPRTAQPSGVSRLRPYEETEHDGHNGDFYFVLKTKGLNGEWVYTTPMRLWLLLLLDRASRAILGYSYRLGSTNYSAVAVMKSFAHQLTKWAPKKLTLPGLAYKSGAGFPSGVTPKGYGRLIDLICFDNAQANRAALTMRGLTRVYGATVVVGRAGCPMARAFIERLNQTLETLGFRRLPIGFNPTKGSKEDRDRALKAAEDYAITEEELDQVIDVMLANYNGDPLSALTNRSPNEYLTMWDVRGNFPVRVSCNAEAARTKLLRVQFIKTIRGGGKAERAPYVQLWWAKYSNDMLRKMTGRIGSKIRLVADIDGDIRLVRGFIKVRSKEIDIGILKAAPPWHLTPHTLEQRKLIRRANKISKIVVPPGSDLVQAFRGIKLREGAENRAAANQLAKVGKISDSDQIKSPERDPRARIPTKKWIKLK